MCLHEYKINITVAFIINLLITNLLITISLGTTDLVDVRQVNQGGLNYWRIDRDVCGCDCMRFTTEILEGSKSCYSMIVSSSSSLKITRSVVW